VYRRWRAAALAVRAGARAHTRGGKGGTDRKVSVVSGRKDLWLDGSDSGRPQKSCSKIFEIGVPGWGGGVGVSATVESTARAALTSRSRLSPMAWMSSNMSSRVHAVRKWARQATRHTAAADCRCIEVCTEGASPRWGF
jgi:hypothetical protein